MSLFSGIGGFELGIQRSCAEAECVGFAEIDKYASIIYKNHFPNHTNYGDITNIDEHGLPDFELLCGGFPCQSFSIAGKRGGFEDTRGTLFFHIARIAKHARPRLLFLENVKGLLSHDGGRTFNTIIAVLDELGYDLQWQVLNSKNHGVPQNRERVFIVGHIRETARPQVFPFLENDSEDIVLPTITTRITADSNGTYVGERSSQEIKQLNAPKHSNERVYAADGISPTLNTMQGGNRQPFIMQRPRGHNKGGDKLLAPTLTGNSYQVVVENDNNIHIRRRDEKGSTPQGAKFNKPSGVTETLRSAQPAKVIENAKIRRLTPKECERLQGFPDDWTLGVSDSQRYKMIGNAVTVNVIEAVAQKLL